jgi:hypothetical protein
MIDHLTEMGAVVARHPNLRPNGFSAESSPSTEMLAPDVLEQFARCTAWLTAAPRTSRPLVGSYWAKHIAERLTGAYVSNGALIAAAAHLGIKLRRTGVNADLAVSLPWVRAEDARSHVHADTMGLRGFDEIDAMCESEDRAVRIGVECVGPWRISPATREITHDRVRWYGIDLDRIKTESDALSTIVHIARKRGVFCDADVGALTDLFDRLGYLKSGRGGATRPPPGGPR